MVLLVTTSRILSALEAVPPASRKDLELPSSLILDTPISHDQLIRLARYLGGSQNDRGEHKHGSFSLNSLLRGTKVYVPPPPKKPEPNPEYLAQKARLLAAAEADAYNRLISPPPLPSSSSPSPIFASSSHDAHDHDSDPLTPSLVLNIFLSVLLTGFSVYWALTKFATPDFLTFASSSTNTNRERGISEPVRVLVSFLAALVVAGAEVGIYAAYLRKVDRARKREERIKERKEVVRIDEVGATGEKEEIWGRGANGGVRRRVRERWEERAEGWE